jgi:hypothetical protein
MPNHITNLLEVHGEPQRVKDFFAFIAGENGAMDFNKVIPMPESLNIEDSSLGEIGMKYWLSKSTAVKERFDRLSDTDKEKALELGKKYIHNKKRYGHTTWYGWARDNWGTKWNAYNINTWDGNTIEWNTAWSGSEAIIEKLVELFPDLEFDYWYDDEDAGYNVGRGFGTEGVLSMLYPDGCTDEAWEIYFLTHEWAREEYHKENGEWVYNEE